jgi:protoporphyrin/coproporphyrin ferrochelatase
MRRAGDADRRPRACAEEPSLRQSKTSGRSAAREVVGVRTRQPLVGHAFQAKIITPNAIFAPSTMTDRAILFLQLGGPETLDEVPGFLYHLFSDPDVIRVRPAILRKAIAASIAFARRKTSRELYRKIGGGSPIRRLTEEQARGVEKLLRARGKDVTIRAAMNCSAPFVEEVVAELAASGARRFLAFPLYPHYSLTTTKGALERTREAVRRFASRATLAETTSWPTHPLFVRAHAELIAAEIAKFRDPRPEAVHLLYSAHSIPKKLVTKNADPYPKEVEASVAAINASLGSRSPSTLAYQSKLGPIEWLGPATLEVIGQLGRAGARQVLAIPIAFVTDHVETLYEIDQLFAEEARRSGIRDFRRTPGLNDHPTFLAALEDLILSEREFWA